MIRTHEEHLVHYGILRKSGRYPWGSGATESKRNRDFLDSVSILRKQGMSDAEIARGFGITRNELTAARSIALAQQKQEKILTAQKLKEKGLSNPKIGAQMGLNESSVRALLVPGEKDKADAIHTTANMLQNQLTEKKYLDIGVGVEHQVGVTRTRLDTAVALLKEKGYEVHNIKVQQLSTGKYTTTRVLAPPGTKDTEVQQNRKEIRQIQEYSTDNGRSFLQVQTPISVNSRRLRVNYAEDGGDKADGVIYVRPGVKDLTLGAARYGQVRIAIDGTHYVKGMAVYKDDLPPGVDLVFNTNKSSTGRKKDALKEMAVDSELPFGSIVRQIHGPDGKVVSAMNIVGSPTKEESGIEGSWDKWSKNLPTQVLSKQKPDLAQKQLDLTFERRQREFDELRSLTNPTVRRNLLEKFGDQTDAAAVHMKAASLPRQATKVLLPIPSMKPNEIYAPSMRDGERVALVRFPHAGTFEIPQLTVNNRNREARRTLGSSAKDAVGVHHSVAERLSGADFDGDTVLVIPNNKRHIESSAALEGLKGFDPRAYKIPKDSPVPRISSSRKQTEMGKISNLIADMTIGGASTEERARAVRHSMVVIDSEKHELDYKKSEKDHGILSLKEKYQGGKRAGASTLISRAGAVQFVDEREPRPARLGGPIDPATGRRVYVPTGRQRPVKKTVKDPVTGRRTKVATGKFEPVQERSKKLAETDDAFTLSSGTHIETIYAAHSNRLKAMANAARKSSLVGDPIPVSKSAKKAYAPQVATVNAKLNLAEKNAPYERQAQLLANLRVSQTRQSNPDMDPAEIKKLKQYALTDARARTGAGKTKIRLTQDEWNAIQAGALSNDKLERVLRNADVDNIRALALPKQSTKLTSTMLRTAQTMLNSGYTQIEVADRLGIGLTTLKVGLSE